MFKIPKKIPEFMQEASVHITGEWSQRTTDNPMSFGKDFNLIRAVAEYGPARVDDIEEEIMDLRHRMIQLQDERDTLTRLISALNTP